ncbi:MAG: hypothetical protein J2P58_03490 [Acidimicrobiaceae bacterium]|nr:hypothetical protein [Acidimicrobiaceae bacterium]
MQDLLDTAIAAHGGLDRWNAIRSISVEASITGAFWSFKDQTDALRDIRFEVDTTRERLAVEFLNQDKRAVFEPDRVELQHSDGATIDGRDDPERSFDGHRFETPWDDLHLAYFVGEALWTYMNVPFLCAGSSFATEEIASIEVDGETWRRLKVTFPESIKTHTREQTFFFGPDGLLRRHDFVIELLGGVPSQLYAADYRDVDGIIIPTTRRAWRGDDHIPEALMIAIDMGEITLR